MEKNLDDGRLEGRSSSIDLRRFEPPRGENPRGGRVLGRWSCQMSFKKSSSKVKRECPLGGVTMQAREKALG